MIKEERRQRDEGGMLAGWSMSKGHKGGRVVKK